MGNARKKEKGKEGAIKIAQFSCGTVYGNVQREIEKAAKEIGAEKVLGPKFVECMVQ